MNYKETVFFVGKCLTITLEEKNKKEIEFLLKTTTIDWDAVVKVSTAHYVFPALYCNLKRAMFLQHLPSELVDYMKYITDLNRDRNQQIIDQAKEINTLLIANNITPIFLKGASYLLEGLYEDIAERMVGDIDFLVLKDIEKTDLILKENGYKGLHDKDYLTINHRHLPRIIHPNKIAAVEIHKKILRDNFDENLTYFNNKSVTKKENYTFLNTQNNVFISILSAQINDFGFHLKRYHLKNCYDVFLLSQKTELTTFIKEKQPFFKICNEYIAVSSLIMNKPLSLKFTKNNKTSDKHLNAYFKKESFFIRLATNLIQKYDNLISFIVKKEYRNYIIRQIKTKLNL
jgi:hypothetical protein